MNSDLEKKYPLSPIQIGMYFDCQMGDPVSYNLSATFLCKNVSEVYFEHAFDILVAEQDVLRACIDIVNDTPVLVVKPDVPYELQKLDFVTRAHEVSDWIKQELNQPFDLSCCPLFRAHLLKLTTTEHLFVFTLHHIIGDGVSFNLLLKKLLAYHHQLAKKQNFVLNQDKGFLAFIERTHHELLQGKYAKQQAFWLTKMQNIKPTYFPVDSAPAVISGLGVECIFPISPEMSSAIQTLSYEQEVTVFTFFLAIFALLLAQYSQEKEVVFASPFSYRPDTDVEDTLGCFIRSVILRLRIETDSSFTQFLQVVAKEFIDAYKNSDYPSNLAIGKHLSEDSTTNASLFDINFVYDMYEEVNEEGVQAEIVAQEYVTFPGHLMVVFNKLPTHDQLKIQYKPELFHRSTIDKFGKAFIKLLEVIIANCQIKIDDIPSVVQSSSKRFQQTIAPPTSESKHLSILTSSQLEETITSIWNEVLSVSDVGLDDNFFDKGGSSLALIQVNNKLKKSNLTLSIRAQFQLPTVRMLVNYFCKKDTLPPAKPARSFAPIPRKTTSHDIAIIGVSVNVPGATTKDAFWQNLKDKKETIRHYQEEELLAMGIPKEVVQAPNYVKASGCVEGTDYFDPVFFDYAPADVWLMSPQYRLLYPGLWQAFEDAGYFPNASSDVIGLFLSGSDDFEWYRDALLNQDNYGLKYQAFTLSTNHFLATRLAYKLDIKGPVFTALSGCSSALLTPHLACQSLLLEECDIAVAGGITVELPNKGGYFYEEGMMFSADGHCRPFDAQASGTFFSNGMALVVLKRLDDALRDKDHIYSVIKGSAVNNDGAQKLGFTAPSVQGQVEAIQKAYRTAGIDPETVSYIEAHGTGTLLGDPVEIESLTQAFATPKKQYCILGSVKGNIGHPDTAAGAVGLVKLALSFENRYLPATANYQTPNPKIDLDNSPFVIKSEGTPWVNNSANQVLRAGINSFGVGGTNVHMVLEQAPGLPQTSPVSQTNLLVFSAKTKTALVNTSKRVVEYLQQNQTINLSDAAWTLQVGRKAFSFRKTLTVQDSFYQMTKEEMLNALDMTHIHEVTSTDRPFIFMFSGQGSQYAGMLKDIYNTKEPTDVGRCVKKHLENIWSLLPEDEVASLIKIMIAEDNNPKIHETQYTQLVIFIVGYALAQMLLELGIQPSALVGHSIGELTAATVAGVFELKDALEIVRFRGRLMQQQAPGVMLAVLQDPHLVQAALPENVWLALKNTTHNCVVGGPPYAIAEFEKICAENEWMTVRVKTSHAFHTPMMDAAAREFYSKLSSYTLKEPQIPIVSNLTGSWVQPQEMSTHAYWVNHMIEPVHFSECLTELFKIEKGIFVEIGPGHVLCSFAKQHADKVDTQDVVNLMRHPHDTVHDETYLYQTIGQLWTLGAHIDWRVIKGDMERYRVSLPTYVFDEEFFPIDTKFGMQLQPKQAANTSRMPDVVAHANVAAASDQNKNLEVVVQAYKTVLGLKQVAYQDDFFALGGDSLKAIAVAGLVYQVLRVKVDVKDLFKYPTPSALADHLHTLRPVVITSVIQPAAVRAHYPLSSAQQRMYMLYCLDKDGLAYNLPSATLIQGKFDRARFEGAITRLIQRHEPLRTRFVMREHAPMQIVDPVGQSAITYSEHIGADNHDIHQLILKFIQPFDLQNGPVFRVQLITLGQERYLFLCDVHHIVADGTSLEILARDFNQLYRDVLPAPQLQYKDYTVWQESHRESPVINEQKEFWLQYLTGELPVLDFPTDYPRPAIKQTKGDRVYFTLDATVTTQLVRLAQDTHTTLFMLLLSAWQILLSRYSGQTDIIVGVPVAGRGLQETIDMMGMFVNILPIRNQVAQDRSFFEFLSDVKTNVLRVFEHQDYPFDDLIQHVNLHRDLGRNVLFDACFDFQNMALHHLNIEDTRFTPIPVTSNTAIYDLLLTCQEDKNNADITGYIEYSTALFKQTTIERIVANLQTLLLEIIRNREVLLGHIDLVAAQEQALLLDTFNQTFLPVPADATMIGMFAQHVQHTPNAVALVLANHKTYTYAELDAASNGIACYLNHLDIQENDVVGIIAQRDEMLFIALLGVLKAGAAFVLIDPMFPAERVQNIVLQSEPKVMLCTQKYKNQLIFAGPILDLDADNYSNNQSIPLQKTGKNALAYIMFTSGSTGQPKGVMVRHAALLNFIYDIKRRSLFQDATDRIISVTTISFDIFMFESLVPLCTGHSIYLASEAEQLDPALAAKKMIEHRVTHIVSTVSRITCFIEHALFKTVLPQLKCIVSGGEHFSLSLLQSLQKLSKAKIYNMYGPTETTVWSTTSDLTQAKTVTVGRPIANTQAYITNAHGLLQPLGVYGELCFSGQGLAVGYLNHSEATAAKFTAIANAPLVYKTGDKARFLETGEIELHGRLDAQIKVRGYRIEPGEIEHIALKHEEIRLASVIGWTDKNTITQIVLYYCLKDAVDASGSQERIKHWLERNLPFYMLPAHYIKLEDMPFLPNGKIDYSALPLPFLQKLALPKFEERMVLSKMENKLLLWWQEILSVAQVGLQDNFFDLGGNSLGLIQINNKLFEEFGYTIPLLAFFQYPTIASFVKNISINAANGATKMPLTLRYNAETQCQDIAVIGLAGKFPGANTLSQFWDNVVTGTESVTHFAQQELLDTGIDLQVLTDANYIRSKGFLEDVEYFDAEFFGYTNADAGSMDPQIRLLHQCVWEALENAGYDSFRYPGSIGLFAGSSSNLLWMSSQLKDYQDFVNAFETIILNEKDFMTTRLSYKLNLKGPSVNIQTACSTSLVAIHQAAQALINGECDMALAGGVSVTFPRKEGYLWHQGLIFSKDGHCKPFSSDATGIVPGNGCGIVLLKPLAKALQDGDHIYSIIKGSAINNDGVNKIGFTAPSVEGQRQVIRSALEKSNIDPEQICYLEAHGTGTALGDPIEIQALKQAWVTEKKNYCALGSIKANIGHLDAAAGVASFIKTSLVLYNRTLPPLANFSQLNPDIDLVNSPFYVSQFAQKIDNSEMVLRAGLSSFGMGGTNAHLVLEQPPRDITLGSSETVHVLPFSGLTQRALADTSKKVCDYLKNNATVKLSDAAWTLQVGRKPLVYRKALVVQQDIQHEDNVILSILDHVSCPSKKEVVFYFPAQCQQAKIRELYRLAENSPLSQLFKRTFDTILNTLPLNDQACFKRISDGFSPLLHFAAQYALAKTCMDIGVIPKAVAGCGLGELVALTAANFFTIETAIKIITHHLSALENELSDAVDLQQILLKTDSYPVQTADIPMLYSLTQEERLGLLGTPLFILFGAEHSLNDDVDNGLFAQEDSMLALLSEQLQNPLHQLIGTIARLWCMGYDIDWSIWNVERVKKRVPLPTYEFTKQFHNDDIVLSAIAPEQKSVIKKQSLQLQKQQMGLIDIWKRLFGKTDLNPAADFFLLGGDSLKASILTAHVQKELGVDMPLSVVFQHTTVQRMQDWIDAQIKDAQLHSITPLPKQAYYAVSSAQKRMYATQALVGGSAIPYNLAAVYHIEGHLDKDKLKNAFDQLVQRHSALRTRFAMKAGEVVQIIEDTLPSVVEFTDSSDADLHANILKNIQPFHLDEAPLFRVKVFALNALHHVLLVDLHHIIADQSSLSILMHEFADFYAGNVSLPPVHLQYRDFAIWHNHLLETEHIKEQMLHWQQEFRDGIPVLDIPTDYPRSRTRSYKGARMVVDMNDQLQSKIERFAKAQRLTPFMLFMSALRLVLWKYTGQTDFVIGTATSGRHHADLLNIVGMFANTLAIRAHIQDDWGMKTYLQHVKEKILLAYENQGCPFEKLVEMHRVEKDLSRNPVFDVVINYLDIEGYRELSLDDLVIKPWPEVPVYSKFDLTWTIEKNADQYMVDIEYASDLYRPETIQMMAKHWVHTLEFIVDHEDSPLSDYSLLTVTEQQYLLQNIDRIASNYPHKTVIQCFVEQVDIQQDQPAIVFENQVLTYKEFDREVNKIAALLRVRGAKHGEKIAILLGRSPLQIASIFAVLKCGCTYVPIDPQYPEARISAILNDSQPSMVVTQSWYVLSDGCVFFEYIFLDKESAFFNDISAVISFEQSVHRASPTDIAYVMYTSGSTGKPKGVLVNHRNIVQLVKNNNFIDIFGSDRVLQVSNYAFDGSVFDIFGALLNGACLVLVSENQLIEMAELTACIQQQKVSLCYLPVALFNALVDWDIAALQGVRKILFGGENPSNQHVRKALNYFGPDRLINAYGPTETTVFSTYYPIKRLEESDIWVPIGFPLARTKLYVLDKQGQLLPPNIIGELYIGGDGVAQGYLNSDELTQKKFINNPMVEEDVIYRTGDLVKQLITGELVFLGREDFQVKIRGFRVELKEIEECIKNIKGVREAVVRLQKDAQHHGYLAAYFSLHPAFMDKQENYHPEIMKAILGKQLPDYMIPARIKMLSSFPLNINGKIDLKSLPEINALQHHYVPSEGHQKTTEQIILSEAQRILDHPGLTVKDNFFHHGGHSIKAIAFIHQLKQVGITLKVNDVFQHPTVEALSALYNLMAQPHNDPVNVLLASMSLSSNQIATVVAYLKSAWQTLANMISSGKVSASFAFAPIQLLHAQQRNRRSGFSMYVYGAITEDKMRRALMQVIQQNQLMHCTPQCYNTTWYEHDISNMTGLIEKSLAYVDLGQYLQATQAEIVQSLSVTTWSTPYAEGELPWRCSCIRLNHNTHQMIWGFDHIAFDGMSADVLRSQIDKIITSTALEPIESYKTYVNFLRKGPQDVNEQEMIRTFHLQEWHDQNAVIMQKLHSKTQKRRVLRVEISLQEHRITDPWQFTFDLVMRLLRSYFGVSTIPLGVIHYGRAYQDQSFYNCVGECLDILPILDTGSASGAFIPELIGYCQTHAINFAALLLDPQLADKFPQINQLLSSALLPKEDRLHMLGFNFQGFIAKEESALWVQATEYVPPTPIAEFLMTAHYNETHITLSFPCYKKERKTLLNEVKTYLMAQDKEVEYV